MADSSVAITAGAGTNIDTYTAPNGDHRQIVMAAKTRGGYTGRFGTFVIPGRAATSHKLAAIHNATGSTILVDVTFVAIDTYQTVIKAVTVPPPVVRLSRFTALPTNGTAATKAPEDSSLTSSTSVTVWQDASADRTSSATALTITTGAVLTQEFIPRMITAAGYEMADRVEFFSGSDQVVTLRALEGVAVELVSPAGTSEPITDMFVVTLRWEEYTP